MAYNPNELLTTADGLGSQKRVEATAIQPKTFGQGSGTLPQLTPVAFNATTGFWSVWAQAGAATETNIIRGLIWPDPVVLDSNEEVLGNVLMTGKVHYADIPLPTGETQPNLKTALIAPDADGATLRDRGILLQGIDSVR